jgi:adenosine deaminase
MAIGSDDPSYMEDIWLNNSLYLLRTLGDFTDSDFLQLQKNAINIRWAPAAILEELRDIGTKWEAHHGSETDQC